MRECDTVEDGQGDLEFEVLTKAKMTETDNRMTPPLEGDGVPTSTTGSNAAITGVATATQKPESNSPGDKPAVPTAEDLPTEGRDVVIIDPPASLKCRPSMIHAILVVAEQNKAKVAATNGRPWSVGQAHVDSPKSSKFGVSLTAGLGGLEDKRLNRGDLVQIEIGRGTRCYQLTGRASRKAAAYFAKTDLAQAGVELHTPFHYVVLGVVSQGGQP